MITLFIIGIIVFTVKLVCFAFKAAWGITKGVLFVIGIPTLMIVLFIAGLVYLAIPLLILALLATFSFGFSFLPSFWMEKGLLEKSESLAAPLTLVSHDSQISCQEIQQFGGASETQAEKIEALWQDIMDFYLRHSAEGKKVCAEHSSHYIHLTDPELVCRLV